MTFDIAINQDKDAYLDGANDLALVSGPERVDQSIAISVMDEDKDFVSGRITAKNVNQLEQAIERGLQDDNDVDQVFNVDIQTFDRNDDRVIAEVFVTPTESFVAEVNL